MSLIRLHKLGMAVKMVVVDRLGLIARLIRRLAKIEAILISL